MQGDFYYQIPKGCRPVNNIRNNLINIFSADTTAICHLLLPDSHPMDSIVAEPALTISRICFRTLRRERLTLDPFRINFHRRLLHFAPVTDNKTIKKTP